MSLKRYTRYIAVSFLVLYLPFLYARADVVHLASGGKVEGKVEDLGESIEVVTKFGTITLKKSQVEEIEFKPLPQEVYQENLKALAPDDVEGHLELAKWCRQHHLNKEYAELLQKAGRIDPDHEEAAKLWYEYQKRHLKLPISESKAGKLLQELGPGFKIRRSSHYLVCYNTDPTFAQQRAYLFEKVYQAFYSYFESKDLKLVPLKERLVAVLFDSRDDYLNYARVRDARLEHMEGFYSGLDNRVVFYNLMNRPEYVESRKQADMVEKRLSALYGQVARASPRTKIVIEYKGGRRLTLSKQQALRQIADDKRELGELKRKMVGFYLDENVSVTVHEVTHQLWFNSGLAARFRWSPHWLSEGVATFFEAAYRGEWAGMGRLNPRRASDYGELQQQGKLLPLERLLVEQNVFFQPDDTQRAAYAQSWALFHYLANRQTEGLRQYIAAVSRWLLPMAPSREKSLELFSRCFGSDLGKLEIELAAYVSQMRAEAPGLLAR